MQRRQLLFGLVAASACGPLVAAATVVEGVSFERQIQLAGAELLLNGTGIRAAGWFKAYVAALYLAGRAATVDGVLAQPGPKRLRMVMLYGAPASAFVKAFNDGFTRNSPDGTIAALRERMQRFDGIVGAIDKVARGDVVDLDFEPERGTSLLLNGQPRGEPIPGRDFYDGLLRAFVGDRPYDKRMRAGLLGARG